MIMLGDDIKADLTAARKSAADGNFASAYEHMERAFEGMTTLAGTHCENGILAVERFGRTVGVLERTAEKCRRATLAANFLSIHVHDLEVGMLFDAETDTHIQTAGHA